MYSFKVDSIVDSVLSPHKACRHARFIQVENNIHAILIGLKVKKVKTQAQRGTSGTNRELNKDVF